MPTHQGRAAENVLFSVLIKEGDYIPGNSHFDTTKGHIEFRKAHAVDLTIDIASDTEAYHPFKGNVDIDKLDNYLAKNANKVPLHCNGCQQPHREVTVSMGSVCAK